MAISKPRHRVWRIAIGETSETGIRCQSTDDRSQSTDDCGFNDLNGFNDFNALSD